MKEFKNHTFVVCAYKESEYYVKLKGSEKNYTRLNKAYQKRLKEIEAKSKQDTEMEIS